VSCAGTLAFGIACSAPTHDGDKANDPLVESAAPFSVLNVTSATSMLSVVEARAGAIKVCLGLTGFGADTAATSTKMQRISKAAFGAWNDLLAGHPDWRVTAVDPVFTVKTSECTDAAEDLRINVWADASEFTSDYCGRRPTWVCSSAGDMWGRNIYIGPINRGVPEDVFDPYTILHEYGHMLGLGDTYRIPGSHDWVGDQPPSVMNRGSLTLTDDDKLGLWVTLRSIKTGSRSCDGFGTALTMTANVWSAIMCDPTTTPGTTHGAGSGPDAGRP